jgi:glycosyltransferase involved in cell wall biosynthesis
MAENEHRTLYLCYFGLREPLVQTQVLPYLREINKLQNLKVSLLTFEPNFKENWTTQQIEIERKKLAAENIQWFCLPYHKRPSVPATVYDVFNGARFVRKLIKKEKINVLHARIQVPALMGAIARKLSGEDVKIIFDIRGFFPEEYTDAGIWKENGSIYRSVKQIEKWLLRESDGFVVLTEKARAILFPESLETGFDKRGRPVEVIPCCIDPKRFDFAETLSRETIRREMNLDGRRVFVYVGSFGGWYLTDEMVSFFAQAHRQNPDTFTMILTQSDADMVKQNLVSQGIAEKDFLIKKVSPAEVPKYLKAADIAVSFIKACYSKQSSSPTKIAEYLASGLPVISNSGIGDLDALIAGDKVGLILKGFTEEDYAEVLTEIDNFLRDENLSEHCRRIAHQKFDLEQVGGKNYRRLYQRLLSTRS